MKTWLLLFFCCSCLAACPSTTGTRVSTLGAVSTLTVPAGQTYIYDVASATYTGAGISVYGTLIFEDTKALSVTSPSLTVFSGGKVVAGSCDCPFTNLLTFTLTGTSALPNNNGVGTKGIGVLTGGTLELYGKIFGPTWTQLSASAAVGATTITLAENVNWRVGDKLVIATTDHWIDQTEERTITAVSGNVVTLNSPLTYKHYGQIYKNVDMRAEVGVLNRQIVITGDSASDTAGLGAHMMFLEGSTVRLSGIEVTKAGQLGVLGRYPVHWHQAKTMAAGQAVLSDSSIHHCYQRCVTIHHTNAVEIRRNVCYKTNGHAFFLEVATEVNNLFAYNLGIAPAASNKVPLPSDTEPAVFWITNPDNTYIHNHAVGGSIGFWYALAHWDLIDPTPTPDLKTKDVIPIFVPLKKFAHNVAHSSTGDCMHVDRGPIPEQNEKVGLTTVSVVIDGVNYGSIGQNYDPQSDPFISAMVDPTRKANNKEVWVNFEDTTLYKCANHGIWLRTQRTKMTGLYISDTSRGLTSATGESTIVSNAHIVGFSPNTPIKADPWTQKWDSATNKMVPSYWAPRGLEFYDGPNNFINANFYNFKDPSNLQKASILGVLDHNVFNIGWGSDADPTKGNWIKGFVLDDPTTPLFAFPWDASTPLEDGEKQFFGWDLDGTLTQRPPANGMKTTFIAAEPFFLGPNCVLLESFTRAALCPSQFLSARLEIQGGSISDWKVAKPMEGFVRLTRGDDNSRHVWYCGHSQSCKERKAAAKDVPRGFAVILLERVDTYIRFDHSGITRISMYFQNQVATETPVVALCIANGATVGTISNWKKVTSRALLDAEPYSSQWDKQGVCWHETSSGWLYCRAFSRNGWLPLEIPISGGSGPANWCAPRVTGRQDTRALPPVNAAAVVRPASWTSPISTTFLRDENLCAGGSAPAPCTFGPWTAYGPCTGTCGTTGKSTRTRTVITGTDCSPLSETVDCAMPACPVNGECKIVLWAGQPTETTVTISSLDATNVRFTVAVKQHSGMVAIGFPRDVGLMPNADAVIGWAGATPSVADYMIGPDRAIGATGIHLDTSQGGTNDIKDASIVEASGGATLTFTRRLAATDAHDRALAAVGQVQNFNIALAAGAYAVAYHGSTKTAGTCIIPDPAGYNDCDLSCGTNAVCADAGLALRLCTCKPGFAPVSPQTSPMTFPRTNTVGLTCVDVNDCDLPCGSNAECMDAGVDLRTCTCKAGFVAQSPQVSPTTFPRTNTAGLTCVDKNDCDITCGTNADCTDGGVDTRTCTCKTGFVAQSPQVSPSSFPRTNTVGLTCTDKNDCDIACGTNADCTDGGMDTRTCTCKTGFSPVSPQTSPMSFPRTNTVGLTCTDASDCDITCGTNADCADAGAGLRTCTCKAGYVPVSPHTSPSVFDRSNTIGLNCVDKNDCDITCGTNADCTDGGVDTRTCTCKTGFSPVSPQTSPMSFPRSDSTGLNCIDKNDCDLTCGTNADCADAGLNLRTCTCKNGYAPLSPQISPSNFDRTNTVGLTCVDKNDCDITCGTNADCTDGGVDTRTCTCKTGFFPVSPQTSPMSFSRTNTVGLTCVDTSDCDITCGTNADCADAGVGLRTCTCKPGFAPQSPQTSPSTFDRTNTVGLTCVDINDCDLSCGENAECADAGVNARRCTCKSGFVPQTLIFARDNTVGLTCADINDCDLSCGTNANCADAGANLRQCTCAPGFTSASSPGLFSRSDTVGLGSSCVDHNDCDLPCGEHATCADAGVDKRSCMCLPGYLPSEAQVFTRDNVFGLTCTDHNDCDLPCGDNAECTDGGVNLRTCTCKAGFSPSLPQTLDRSNTVGITCSEISDCDLTCGENANCADAGVDLRACTCKPGFTTDTGVGPFNLARTNTVGINCVDISDCDLPCGLNADCRDAGANLRECQCKAGYFPTSPSTFDRSNTVGLTCSDSSDCDLTCGDHAICSDAGEGLRSCSCETGYAPTAPQTLDRSNTVGIVCTDVSDCDLPCGDNASCEDAGINSRKCTCDPGFAPTLPSVFGRDNTVGLTCVEIDDCDLTCGENTKCADAGNGKRTCTCVPGFVPAEGQTSPQTFDRTNTVGLTCLPKDDCDLPCGENADCVDAGINLRTCTCKEGFAPTQPQTFDRTNTVGVTCTDFNDCDLPCGENADCKDNGVKSRVCTCKEGFFPAGPQIFDRSNEIGILCNDFDDCDLTCGENAGCLDAGKDLRTCTCKPGYVPVAPQTSPMNLDRSDKVGLTCVDFDDCDLPCGDNTLCEDAGVNARKCTCKPGFGPNSEILNRENTQGLVCKDHDDCDLACGENAACEDAGIDLRKCTCNPGFQPVEPQTFDRSNTVGLKCADYNDCDLPCGLHATCLDSGVNTRTCQCEAGFLPLEPKTFSREDQVGLTCSDQDDCDIPCGPHTTCTDAGVSKRTCACLPGFVPAKNSQSPATLERTDKVGIICEKVKVGPPRRWRVLVKVAMEIACKDGSHNSIKNKVNNLLEQWFTEEGWEAILQFSALCQEDGSKKRQTSSAVTFTGILEGADAEIAAPLVDPKVRELLASEATNSGVDLQVEGVEVAEVDGSVTDDQIVAEEEGGVSIGLIVGVVVGAIAAVLLIVAAVYLYKKDKLKKSPKFEMV